MRVFVLTGDQLGLARFVQASTTMTRLLDPVMVNPKRFVRRPKAASLVCTCGFHSTSARPPKAVPRRR